jgi:hypothetical protein
MIEQAPEEWIATCAELNRVGDVFDNNVATALEQTRLACAHNITLFTYEGCKLSAESKKAELVSLRSSLSPVLRYNTAEEGTEGRPEEDVVVSFIVGQIEMEAALEEEYDKIISATKAQAFDLQTFTAEFEAQQTMGMQESGAWFDEHRETMKKHAAALEITLERVREKVDSGYENLRSRISALDYDAEQMAEEELAAAADNQGSRDSGAGQTTSTSAANNAFYRGANSRNSAGLFDPTLYGDL